MTADPDISQLAAEMRARAEAAQDADVIAILDAFDARGREIERLTQSNEMLELSERHWISEAEKAISALAEARRMVETLADLIQCLVDNDPDEPISDNGFVVLDKWRHDAARALVDVKGGARDG